MNFIENCHSLNNIEEYKKLTERGKTIGFEITKVVFRGYITSPTLQLMHDSSMQMRTQLKLEVKFILNHLDIKRVFETFDFLKFESEQQNQEQLDFNLKNEMNRLKSGIVANYFPFISEFK